ncbi:ATP-binding protein [bacterium]|nr:MAG: ATP-binding protein [bacterium]
MYDRSLLPALLAALADTPVTLLAGPRQAGKSTLARDGLAGSRPMAYVTLDDAAALASAHADPVGFVDGLREPTVIDEVQRATGLFPAIKASVDRDRRPGRFLLTGSANVLMLPNLSESLAGRMVILTLWPLAQSEIERTTPRLLEGLFAREFPSWRGGGGRVDIVARAIRGGYPEAVARADSRRRQSWFGSYITTMMQREVRDIANVADLAALPRLLQFAAARAASLLNMADLSRDSGIAPATLKRYLALLEATYLVHRLPAWARNATTRLVKSPKLLIVDSGLMAYLLRAADPAAIGDDPRVGSLVENFVGTELLKLAGCAPERYTISYFRTQHGMEVDFVIEDARGNVAGIEVKTAATVSARDFNGLRALAAMTGSDFRRGIVLYTGAATLSFGDGMFAVPVSALWSAPIAR